MTKLAWDQAGDRKYEAGVDRGVLYVSDRSGVAWNGLTAVEDRSSAKVTPLYFDGVKYDDVYVQGDFAANLKAYTYPDEFMEFEGVHDIANGLMIADQTPRTFGLSWRTMIGNDQTPELGYRIHILDNLLAVPSTKASRTLTRQATPFEFEWNLSAIPVRVLGYRPSPHLIFDTTKSSSAFVTELEDILYGTDVTEAKLPIFTDLVEFAKAWAA